MLFFQVHKIDRSLNYNFSQFFLFKCMHPKGALGKYNLTQARTTVSNNSLFFSPVPQRERHNNTERLKQMFHSSTILQKCLCSQKYLQEKTKWKFSIAASLPSCQPLAGQYQDRLNSFSSLLNSDAILSVDITWKSSILRIPSSPVQKCLPVTLPTSLVGQSQRKLP